MKSKLSHIDLNNYYQFVTFRTKDSLTPFLQNIKYKNIINSKKQYLIDKHLDNSKAGSYLFGENIKICKDIFFEKNKIYYDLLAFSVMPNHIHILFKQKISLPKIIKYLKAKSAVELNKNLKKDSSFWAKDYYDKVIRDSNHFEVVYNYIKYNASKANLEDANERFYGVYE